ncbi:MAG: hypothetical protein Q9201_007543, partial [Fulgogasparrea decipioides]
MDESYHEASQDPDLPAGQGLQAQHDPSATAPIEMTRIEEQPAAQVSHTPQKPLTSIPTEAPKQTISPQSLQENRPDINPPSTDAPVSASLREPLAITSANRNATPTSTTPHLLTREKTGPAIGPPLDKPAPIPQESDPVGQTLLITILLITGARHPFRIDEKYLKKRNVNIDGGNPFNMSVYTLKELIWREWRDDWEIRPSSPSAIRLIYYGKMLEDKSRLHDCRFEPGLTPHVVHMTIKPQEIIDEEDAKIAKTGTRDRDGSEGSTGCRC